MAGAQEIQLPVAPTFGTPNTDSSYQESINAILKAVPPPVRVTAAPYSTQHDPTPTLPIQHNFQMSDEDRQPVNNSLEERKRARQTNFAASLGNTVKTYINRHEEKQQQQLTTEITTVMKAQQQIDNAKAILQADPRNELAQQVLQRNMEILNSKLSNDKLRKQIGKAFDVSFIDPSKNDTPEIKAGQAAAKEVHAAIQAGTAADTPQEKALAQMHQDGGNPPAQQAAAQAKATANTKPSSPGYAEQFLNRLPQSIGTNPEYAAQLKQQEARDKLVTQHVIPRLIDATEKYYNRQLAEGNANERAKFKGATDAYVQQMKTITTMAKTDADNAAKLKGIASRNWALIKATQIRSDALVKIAGMRGINGTIHKAKMQELAIGVWNKSIGQIDSDTKALTDIATNIQADNSIPPEEKQRRLAAVNASIDFNTTARQILADNRQKTSNAILGAPQADKNNPAVTDTTKGYINVTGNNAPDKSAGTSEVGTDDDDSSSGESSGDDSSEYGVIDSYDVANQ